MWIKQKFLPHLVLTFKYLIEATADNFQEIEAKLEEILIEGIATDLCNEEVIKEAHTNTDLTEISSCTPQQSSNICKNTQGEISLEITDEALQKNLAEIESALENSFSAHMPEALSVSGLNRLDVTAIELKGKDFVLKGKITPVVSSSTKSPSEEINSSSATSKRGKSSKGNTKSAEKYYKNSYSSSLDYSESYTNTSTSTSTILPTYTSSIKYSISSSSSNGYSLKSDKSKSNKSKSGKHRI